VADWVTISSLATAGGTLVLAVATFSSVKSGSRSARIAERSLLAGLRPLLIPSREEDPEEHVVFIDGQRLSIPGHGAAIEVASGNVYLGIALRNGGSGLAVLHGWRARPREGASDVPPDVSDFRRQTRDLYIPAGYTGFWQGASRDREDPIYPTLRAAAEREEAVFVDLLYGDHEGGQRAIVRMSITSWENVEGKRAEVTRYWNVDRDDPR
jgi:hypothetical protein